jgi:hypothetical protein
MDTDMSASISPPKANPRDTARIALQGIEAGLHENLADRTSRQAQSELSGGVMALYPSGCPDRA